MKARIQIDVPGRPIEWLEREVSEPPPWGIDLPVWSSNGFGNIHVDLVAIEDGVAVYT